jgi:hypothetical protein
MAGMGRVRCGIGAVAVACVAWLAAGCGAGRPAPAGSAGTGKHAGHSETAAGIVRGELAARYLVIARAGNRRLEIDFDGLEGRDRNHLAAAEADLRDAAVTERLFDRRLLQLSFPPAIEATARWLYQANQSRAALTATAAGAVSLRDLHADERVVTAANGPVEEAVRMIRRQLGLPPPATS